MRLKNKIAVVAALLAVISLPVLPIFAEVTSSELLAQQQIQKNELEQQLKQIEDQIAQYEKDLSGIRSEKNTLASKIKQLKTERSALSLRIQQTTLNIQNIENELNVTQDGINDNNEKIEALKSQVAAVLLNIYDRDQRPAIQTLISNDGLSGFYDEITAYNKINQNLAALMDRIRAQSAELKDQQDRLSNQKEEQQNLIAVVNLQSQKLAESLADQDTILQKTKGRESDYQLVLNDTKKKANEIHNRLYDLLGVNKQVTFGQAVEIAQNVSGMTGVRAAFLLAVLTQESNLGKNVGTCNRAGDPPEKSWRVVMKPERDQQPFLQITSELGLDPNTTPVSCPMKDAKGQQVGWGGAMGPAQFIPSTWMGYKDKVAAITGKRANPWDIRDAFIAAGLKLKAGGAGTVEGEWAAAMLYFSGSTNPQFRFYGDNVVAKANQYQNDIETLK